MAILTTNTNESDSTTIKFHATYQANSNLHSNRNSTNPKKQYNKYSRDELETHLIVYYKLQCNSVSFTEYCKNRSKYGCPVPKSTFHKHWCDSHLHTHKLLDHSLDTAIADLKEYLDTIYSNKKKEHVQLAMLIVY